MAQETEYHGYKFTTDGKIYRPNGKRVTPYKGTVKIVIDGKRRTLKIARLMYEAFNGEKLPNGCIIHLSQGDENHPRLDDIEILDRKEYFQKHPEWMTQKRIPANIVEKIREEYNYNERKKHGFKGKYRFPTYNDLATKYNCSKSTIYKIIKGSY